MTISGLYHAGKHHPLIRCLASGRRLGFVSSFGYHGGTSVPLRRFPPVKSLSLCCCVVDESLGMRLKVRDVALANPCMGDLVGMLHQEADLKLDGGLSPGVDDCVTTPRRHSVNELLEDCLGAVGRELVHMDFLGSSVRVAAKDLQWEVPRTS